jgi:DHA1 family multidrug resistance protein-like MFS transporter
VSLSRDNRLLALSLFLWGSGEGLFFYIRPLYLKELGADPVAIGSILSLAFLANGLTHIPAGYLADRFGRKQVLLAGWVLGIFAAGLMYAAQSLEWFVVGFVAYLSTGFVIAPINAYVSEARGPQSVQRALTLVSAGFWAGNVFSPALGGWIGERFGLRQVFGVALIAFTASTVAMLPLRPQALSQPAAGESRYRLLFRNRRFLGFLALIFVAMVPMQLGVPFLPNYMVDVRHLRVEDIGLLGSVNSLGVVLVSVTLGHRAPRRGFMIGQMLMSLSMMLVLFTTGAAWFGLAYFCQAGWNLARSMTTAQVGRVIEKQEIGLAYGVTETMAVAAVIIASQVAGLLYARSAALPFQVSLVLVGLALPLVWWLAPRRDAHSPEAMTTPVTEAGEL